MMGENKNQEAMSKMKALKKMRWKRPVMTLGPWKTLERKLNFKLDKKFQFEDTRAVPNFEGNMM